MRKNIKITNLDPKIINKSAIARKLDCSPSYVSRILSGKRVATTMREKIIQLIKKELRAA